MLCGLLRLSGPGRPVLFRLRLTSTVPLCVWNNETATFAGRLSEAASDDVLSAVLACILWINLDFKTYKEILEVMDNLDERA